MPNRLTIQHLTLGDLAGPSPWQHLHDLDAIAPMSPAKREIVLANPFTDDPDTVVQLLASIDDTIVGRVDLMPGALLVHGQRIMTSWGSGMYVPEHHRGKGIGKALAQHRETVHETCCSCGVSQMLLPIYTKLGWTDFPMQRYIHLRTARPVAQRLFGASLLGKAAAAVGNLAVAAHHGVLACARHMTSRGLRVECVDAMPNATSNTWAELLAPRDIPVAVERTVASINWMLRGCFEPHPRNRQDLFLITDQHDQPVGYALTKLRYHETASHRGFRDILLGSVQDWMIFDDRRLSVRGLALLVTRELAARHADAVEICLPASLGSGGLRTLGFVPLGAQHLLFKAAPTSPLADAHLANPASWRFRPCEGDNVFT
jgi:GNAT superfamily N-acetyltransferase